MAYATLQEVLTLGLRAEAYAARPRAVENVDASVGLLTITNHGLFATAPLFRFAVEGAAILGKQAAALPVGLSASLMYTAVRVSSDFFKAVPVGGSVITTFGDVGGGVFSIRPDVEETILAIAADESAQINNSLTGHSPPILVDQLTGLYPPILRGVVARRTSIRAALIFGTAAPEYAESLKLLIAGQTDDNARLAEWIAGREILPAVLDQDLIPNDAPRARGRAPLGFGCRRTL